MKHFEKNIYPCICRFSFKRNIETEELEEASGGIQKLPPSFQNTKAQEYLAELVKLSLMSLIYKNLVKHMEKAKKLGGALKDNWGALVGAHSLLG